VREVALAMLASLVASAVAAPFVFKMLVAMKSRQNVSAHLAEHQHKQGTPTMGGIIVLIGLLCGMACTWRAEYLGVLVLVLGFAAVGFADDFLVPKMKPGSRGLHWAPKLGLEIGAAVLGASLSGWQTPVELCAFVFMVLFLSNAYNFSDGLDTLAGGLGVILCLGLIQLIYTYHTMHEPVAPAIAGALFVGFLPFLVLNAPPARVFMGDVGALPIGAVLAWIAASFLMPMSEFGYELNLNNLLPLLILFSVMLAEIIPPPLQVFWVKVFKKRLFNFKTPIHHAFQERGGPETRIVWLFHVVQAGLVVLALGVLWL
jgi:phospho-N-acetylmuramoyl-pentapeptide-transferase